MSINSYALFSSCSAQTLNTYDSVSFDTITPTNPGPNFSIGGSPYLMSIANAGYYMFFAIFSCYTEGENEFSQNMNSGGTTFALFMNSTYYTGIVPNTGSYGSIPYAPTQPSKTDTTYVLNNQVCIVQSFVIYVPANSQLSFVSLSPNVTIFSSAQFNSYITSPLSTSGTSASGIISYTNNCPPQSPVLGINCSVMILEINNLSYLYGFNLSTQLNYGNQQIAPLTNFQLNNTNSLNGVINNLNVLNKYVGSSQCSNFNTINYNSDFTPITQSVEQNGANNYNVINATVIPTPKPDPLPAATPYLCIYNSVITLQAVSPYQGSAGSNVGNRFLLSTIDPSVNTSINNEINSETYVCPVQAIGIYNGNNNTTSYYGGGSVIGNNTSLFNVFGISINNFYSTTTVVIQNLAAGNEGVITIDASTNLAISLQSCNNNEMLCNNANLTMLSLEGLMYASFTNNDGSPSSTNPNVIVSAGAAYSLIISTTSTSENLFVSYTNDTAGISFIGYNGTSSATFAVFFTITTGNILSTTTQYGYPSMTLQTMSVTSSEGVDDDENILSPTGITYGPYLNCTYFSYVGYSSQNIMQMCGQFIYTFQPYTKSSEATTWNGISLINPGQYEPTNSSASIITDVTLYSNLVYPTSSTGTSGQTVCASVTMIQIG